MLTLKASVAALILVCAVAATAGATYVATKATVTVSCPAIPPTPAPSSNRGIPLGNPLPLNQGKKW